MNPESRVHEEICPTLRAEMGDNQASVAYCIQGNVIDRSETAGANGDGKICPTITGDHNGHISDYTALCVGNGQMCNMSMAPVANSLDCMHDQQAVIVLGSNQNHATVKSDGVCNTLPAAMGEGGGYVPMVAYGLDRAAYNQGKNAVVRRLTPMECERLQGFPDHWTDIGEWYDTKGKRHKTNDSQLYRALGNSLALPFWAWLAERICEQYDRPVEMASLFDGIGGFPLVFERAGAKAVWASEVEEFCIAVTKRRFPE